MYYPRLYVSFTDLARGALVWPQPEIHFAKGLELGWRYPEHIAGAVDQEVNISEVVHVGAISIVISREEGSI